MRAAGLVALVAFSLMACTQTYSWKPLTSESRPPAAIDPNTLVGKNVRFLMADSTTVEMNVREALDHRVVGNQSNPYLPADTLVVDLRDVLRIEREEAGVPRATKETGVGVALWLAAGLVLMLVLLRQVDLFEE